MDRGHDQVVEVQRVGLPQPSLVGGVRRGAGLLEPVPRAPGRLLGVVQLVLVVGHPVEQHVGRVALRVELEVLGDQRHQPLGVGRVVDREGRLEAESLVVQDRDLLAEDPHAGGVEGAHPHDPGPLADEVLDPLLHLGRGLVGEGDGQDRTRMGSPLADEPRDPTGQHPGLARPRTGHHQQRRARVDHGRALRLVESCEQLVSVGAEALRLGLEGIEAGNGDGGTHVGFQPTVPTRHRTASPTRQCSSSATTESTTATRSPPVSARTRRCRW